MLGEPAVHQGWIREFKIKKIQLDLRSVSVIVKLIPQATRRPNGIQKPPFESSRQDTSNGFEGIFWPIRFAAKFFPCGVLADLPYPCQSLGN